MDRSRHEIEVKLRFDSPEGARRALESVGAIQTREREYEDNVLFDLPDGPLESAKKVLRLRRRGSKAWLTFKAPVPGEHRHKVREEHESAVDDADAIARIVAGLGYRPAYRYEKYRTLLSLEDLALCLDETPLGCFVELEGAPESIDKVAARLGFAVEQYIRESYLDLHEQAAARDGRERGDMVFAKQPAERPSTP